MNEDHIKNLIEQIEFAHKRGIKDDHSEKELERLNGLLKPKKETKKPAKKAAKK